MKKVDDLFKNVNIDYNNMLKKITNSTKRDNRKHLLTTFEFRNLQDARKGLNMKERNGEGDYVWKVNEVYEVMMTKYNEQYEKTKKKLKKEKYKEKQQIKEAVALVKAFNNNNQNLTIDNITPKKLTEILLSIDLNKRSILEVDGQFHTLTPNKVKKILLDIEQFWIEENEDYVGGSDKEVIMKIKNVKKITLYRPKWKGKNKNEGAFFKYYHNTKLDLDKFGIHKEKQENYNENCFVQALITLGVDDETVKGVRSMICSKYLPTNKLSKIAEKYELYIRIKTLDTHKDTLHFGNKKNKQIDIGLIDRHYFAITEVKITSFALKNYFDLCHIEDYNQIIKKTLEKAKRYINSWRVIKYMFENKDKYFKLIPIEHLLDTQYNELVQEITDLKYSESAVKSNEKKEKKDINAAIVFFDFETNTGDIIHKPYMVCNSETLIKYGERCGYLMLRDLYEKFNGKYNTIILIAHNLGYDFRFIQQYLTIESIKERGHNVLEVKGRFYYSKGKYINIILKDSYSIITMSLKKFGKCFNLEQEKEIMPYSLYTSKNIAEKYVHINNCKTYCNQQVRCDNLDIIATEDDYETYFKSFLDNCSKWNCIKEGFVDIIEYSKIYCQKDVEVLQKGYNKFADMLKESCNMRIEDFISSAQLAHQYMLENDVFEDVMQLSSIPREYIMKCVVGGRTMCSENKMQHVIDIIDDFDAVSLYPSAMSRLGGYLKGKPKVLENRSLSFLEKQDGYFVKIKVNKVNKSYKFPLMSYVNDDGVRIFSNTPKGNLYVCKFELEDLIKYHKIEFDIIDGYYYNEGRNRKLKETIDFVFNERLKLKKQKNSLEQIYKLIMNSSYGKTIQRAIAEDIKFVSKKDLENFIDKHYNRMSAPYEELYGSNDDDYKRYKVKVEKGINEHFNNAHCGVEVLAMSKRIMNEVMCLAEYNNLDIYYQDTDSMHIKHKDIKLLAEKFKETYGRELIGKGMGQFHTDFESEIITGNTYVNKSTGEVIKKNMKKDKRKLWLEQNVDYEPEPEIHAIECYFLGKKCYIDKLQGCDIEGNIVHDYHIRMKGVPNSSIKYKSKIEGRNLMDIYKSLYELNKEEFDLCCDGDKIRFEYNTDFTISTKLKFTRELKFAKQIVETDVNIEKVDAYVENANHYIYVWRSNYCNSNYIGRTINFESRRRQHVYSCNNPNDKYYNKKLYTTMREYGGIENWTMEVIDSFYAKDKREADNREQEWIDKLRPSLQMLNPVRKEKILEFNI